MNIGAIGRMLDMARAQQGLDECSECEADLLRQEQDELKQRAEIDPSGGDDNKRQIQY